MEPDVSAVAQLFTAIFQKSVLPKQQIIAEEADKRSTAAAAAAAAAVPKCCQGKNKLVAGK